MAKKFYETQEFKELNKKWNKKLEKAGFEDIDPGDTEEIEPQKFTLPGRKTQYEHGSPGYYDLCQKILQNFNFKTEVHKYIFELHMQGRSLREISSEVEKKYNQSFHFDSVDKFIKRTKDTFIYGKKQ
jgi:hypothetical protein